MTVTAPTLPSARPLGTPMSPAQAAHHAKVSRRTLMRAIDTQELPAFRDNRNRWQIRPEDLEKWADAQCAPSGHAHPLPTPLAQDETALELAAARATIPQLEARLAATEQDRDRWRAMAETLAARAPDPPDPPTPPRRRWWPW